MAVKKFREKRKFINEKKNGQLVVGISALGQYRYVGTFDTLELALVARNAVLMENNLIHLVRNEI